MSEATADTKLRHVRAAVGRNLLSYVHRMMGDDAVAEVLARAGRTFDGGDQGGDWWSHDDIVALGAAAAVVCGDASIGRRAGEEHMRSLKGGADYLRGTGSVTAGLEVVADASNKMSDGRTFEAVEAGEATCTIVSRYVPPGKPDRFFCDYGIGGFEFVPRLFGFEGAVSEPECMSRGDDRCVYVVRWWPPAGETGGVDEGQAEASRQRFGELIERFEQLHALASELADAKDVDTVLERITEHASSAVRARRHLLAVRPQPGARVRVRHRNFDDDEADGFARRLLADDLEDDDAYVIVEVASATRSYGRLVAVYPKGAQVLEPERRLLAAYAKHAASALEAVATLEAAQADRDTAEALLDLAHTLAEVGTSEDIAVRLSEAVPAVAGCQRTDVWLWNPDRDRLEIAATWPDDAPQAETFLTPDRHADLVEGLRRIGPFIVGVEEAVPVVRKLMVLGGLRRVAVVPIRAGARFFGLIAAGYTSDAPADVTPERDTLLLQRLRGMADQAATALHNAELLDQIRAQALRDPLTGLPNRALLEDRARQALAHANRVGQPTSLLFIDLDRFKPVNDQLGHDVGDELLRQAAERLTGCLRDSDTLARLGGDEFVIVLRDTSSDAAAHVADKVLQRIGQPYQLGRHTVSVSASIGIATAPQDGDDFTALLRHADAAMYDAKDAGRNTYTTHQPPSGPLHLDHKAIRRQKTAAPTAAVVNESASA